MYQRVKRGGQALLLATAAACCAPAAAYQLADALAAVVATDWGQQAKAGNVEPPGSAAEMVLVQGDDASLLIRHRGQQVAIAWWDLPPDAGGELLALVAATTIEPLWPAQADVLRDWLAQAIVDAAAVPGWIEYSGLGPEDPGGAPRLSIRLTDEAGRRRIDVVARGF